MPRLAKIYIGSIVGLGLAVTVASTAGGWALTEPRRFFAFSAIACLAAMMKIRLPKLTGTMSASFLLVLLGIADLSLLETLLLGAAATVVQCYCWSRTRPRAVQLLFNVSAVLLSIAGAWQTARLTIAAGPVLSLAAAASAYFVLNTGLVSTVWALLAGKPLSSVWRQCHLWAFPYYLVGAALAAAMSSSGHNYGWAASLLMLPLMWLVHWNYRLYVGSQMPTD